MRKKLIICLFFLITIISILPVSIQALEISNYVSDNICLLDGKNYNRGVEIRLAPDNEQDCNSLLGDPTDENSVAWLLQQIFNFIKIVGPILVVIISSVDFAQVIINSDDDAMAKALKKLGHRLMLAALLFFIPLLVEVALDLFGFTSSCGLN